MIVRNYEYPFLDTKMYYAVAQTGRSLWELPISCEPVCVFFVNIL